ncbi:MAG: hypothetical protein IPM83_01255 [Ignavibacteria bacterium]|nr:hypothetical protein [Ignavibacteria bacterium]
MTSWLYDVFDDQLARTAKGDEVLQMLRHRAAFRTMLIVAVLALLIALYGRYISESEAWHTVTLTLAFVLIAIFVTYESILAYYGVLTGEEELLEELRLPRSVVIAKSVTAGISMGVYISILQYLAMGSDDLTTGLPGLFIAAAFGVIHFRRWRKAIAG